MRSLNDSLNQPKTPESLFLQIIRIFGALTSEVAKAAPVGPLGRSWTALQAPPRPPAARQIISADYSSLGKTFPKSVPSAPGNRDA